jgi:hypothetical protein
LIDNSVEKVFFDVFYPNRDSRGALGAVKNVKGVHTYVFYGIFIIGFLIPSCISL